MMLKILDYIKTYFEITDLGSLKLYLGINITRDRDGIFYIDQKTYINNILNYQNMMDAKVSQIHLDPGYFKFNDDNNLKNNNQYRKAIGSLLYLARNSRSDIALSVSVLSRKVGKPNKTDWNEVKRVMRYLKGTQNFKLCVGTKRNMNFEGYTDSDWAGVGIGRKSTSGCIFKLGDATIHYAARKQNIVTLSSTEAELVALTEASQEAVWLIKLLNDFKIGKTPKLYVDNQRVPLQRKFSVPQASPSFRQYNATTCF